MDTLTTSSETPRSEGGATIDDLDDFESDFESDEDNNVSLTASKVPHTLSQNPPGTFHKIIFEFSQ